MTFAGASVVGLSFILNMVSVHKHNKYSETNGITSNDTKHSAYKLEVANRNYSFNNSQHGIITLTTTTAVLVLHDDGFEYRHCNVCPDLITF